VLPYPKPAGGRGAMDPNTFFNVAQEVLKITEYLLGFYLCNGSDPYIVIQRSMFADLQCISRWNEKAVYCVTL